MDILYVYNKCICSVNWTLQNRFVDIITIIEFKSKQNKHAEKREINKWILHCYIAEKWGWIIVTCLKESLSSVKFDLLWMLYRMNHIPSSPWFGSLRIARYRVMRKRTLSPRWELWKSLTSWFVLLVYLSTLCPFEIIFYVTLQIVFAHFTFVHHTRHMLLLQLFLYCQRNDPVTLFLPEILFYPFIFAKS